MTTMWQNGIPLDPRGWVLVGPAVTDTGGVLRSGRSLLFYDNFDRADTALGSIGAPLGAGAYTLLGPQALAPATDGQILNGRFVSTPGNVIYATQYLPVPVNVIGARIVWTDGNGGSNAGTAAFLISPQNGTNLIANSAIHITMTRSQFVIGYILGSSIVNSKTVIYNTPIPLNTEITAQVRIMGNIVRWSINGITGEMKLPIATFIGLGTYATWEHYYASSSVSDLVAYTAVWAGAEEVEQTSMMDLCVALWRFRGTTWSDSSGQGLTFNSATGSPTVSAGKLGNALTLVAASSQYLTKTNVHQLQLAGKEWTLAFWVNPATISGTRAIWNKGTSTTLELDVFLDSSGRVNAIASPTGQTSSGSVTVINTTALTAGQWAFVVVAYDPSSTRMGVSINGGAFTTQVLTSVYLGTSDMRLGYASRLGSSYFDGQIGPIYLFSSAPGHGGYLSPTRLLELYNDGDGVNTLP